MKKKLLGGLAVASILAMGVGFTINMNKNVEAKADAPLAPGQPVYLCPNNDWKGDNARFAMYYFKSSNNTDNGWLDMTAMTKKGTIVANTYYTATIPEGYDTIIFCRMNPNGINSFDNGNKWNQTNDLPVGNATSNTYNITGWNNSGEWASYSINAEGYDKSVTFYAGSPDGSAPTVHAFGDSLVTNTGVWPGTPMSAPEKIVFKGKRLYRFTLDYKHYKSDASDTSFKMVLSNGGDSNKTSDIDPVEDGAYYFPDGDNRWSGYGHSKDFGVAAAAAFTISSAELCPAPSTMTADSIKEAFITNEVHLSDATWSENNNTYEEVLRWVDKYSSTPVYLSNTTVAKLSEGTDIPLFAIIGSSVAVASIGGLLLIRRRRTE